MVIIYRRPKYEYTPVYIRRLVIYQSEVLRKTSAQITIDLNLTRRTVQRIRRRWHLLGVVIREPHREGPPRILDSEGINFLMNLLAHSPDLTLEEIKDELWYRHNISIGLSSLSKELRDLDLPRKQLSKRAIEASIEKRTDYLSTISSEPAEYLVFVDESAVNTLTTFRTHGRAPAGQRAFMTTNFVRGERYSVLPALTLGGVIWMAIVLGSFNGTTFLEFLDGLLTQMNAYPAKNSVLVLDNCAIHHIDGVTERCAAKGVKLNYLPPYSPDFNPIEEMFSAFKAYIRRHGKRLRRFLQSKDRPRLSLFFHEAINSVATPNNISGWFRKYRRPV